MSSLTSYLKNPERLDNESLYGLRTLVARHPGFTAARLALLHNLFVLHDASFSSELRKAAFLVPDRRVLFNLVEADKYHIEPEPLPATTAVKGGRTLQVIDKFLGKTGQTATHRQPTVADATSDYAAFLLSLDDAPTTPANDTTERLMNDFLEGRGKIQLNTPAQQTSTPTVATQSKSTSKKAKSTDATQDDGDDTFFTETLAKIYIKQGRFAKALEIISTLSANYPNKSVYFADQMRYLRKLLINETHKK